jgi:hypothetical protein
VYCANDRSHEIDFFFFFFFFFSVFRSSLSEHAAGRAFDAMLRRANDAVAQRLADWLARNAQKIGVQSVIYARRVWGYGRFTWRPYTGVAAHYDHIHVGINKVAATALTEALIETAMAEDPVLGAPFLPRVVQTQPASGGWLFQVAASRDRRAADAVAARSPLVQVVFNAPWYRVRSKATFRTSAEAVNAAIAAGFQEYIAVAAPAGWGPIFPSPVASPVASPVVAAAAPGIMDVPSPLIAATETGDDDQYVYQVAAFSTRAAAARFRGGPDVSIQESDGVFRIRSVARFSTEDEAEAAARARGHRDFIVFRL